MKTSVNKMKLFLNLLTMSLCLWKTTAFAAEGRLVGLEIDGSIKRNQWVLRADIEPLGKVKEPAIVSLDQTSILIFNRIRQPVFTKFKPRQSWEISIRLS